MSLKDFRRLPCEDGLNSLLNYGYAVLLLRIEQKLLAFGLDPLYGMGHALRERSLPLAYDMMEPFRPIVDELVYDWVKTHDASTDALEVTQEYKLMMHTMMEKYGVEFRFCHPKDTGKIISKVLYEETET